MDIGIAQIVDQISSSTTSYLVTFSPLFLFIGGVILAMVVLALLVQTIFGIKMLRNDENDDRMI